MILGILGARPADEVAPRLWQGGFPLHPSLLREAGIHAIVLCALEMQPNDEEAVQRVFPPDLEVILAPLVDEQDGPTAEEVTVARKAAIRVHELLRNGYSVLTTCVAGRNRSGLVNALALVRGGMSGRDAAAQIRSRRLNALTNPGFSAFLESIP